MFNLHSTVTYSAVQYKQSAHIPLYSVVRCSTVQCCTSTVLKFHCTVQYRSVQCKYSINCPLYGDLAAVLGSLAGRRATVQTQCCTVMYITATLVYSTLLYSTAPIFTVLHQSVQFHILLYSAVLYNSVQYSTVKYCTVQSSAVTSTVPAGTTYIRTLPSFGRLEGGANETYY